MTIIDGEGKIYKCSKCGEIFLPATYIRKKKYEVSDGEARHEVVAKKKWCPDCIAPMVEARREKTGSAKPEPSYSERLKDGFNMLDENGE